MSYLVLELFEIEHALKETVYVIIIRYVVKVTIVFHVVGLVIKTFHCISLIYVLTFELEIPQQTILPVPFHKCGIGYLGYGLSFQC